jgi:DNA-binding protein HU-beta
MKLDEVIVKVADATEISRPQLRKAVKALFAEIKSATDAGEKVNVPGWGVFALHERQASERVGKDGVVKQLPASRRLMMRPAPIKKAEGKEGKADKKAARKEKKAESRKSKKKAAGAE